ncbi:MAG: hypothetical protein ABWW69_07875 [Pyrodictiaceae archaeon]
MRGLPESLGVTFAVAFMVMLVAAAVALALGQEPLANKMAEIAYYFLVVAVVSQIIGLARERRQ